MKEAIVSVIVTTYNNHETLGACLRSIDRQRYKSIELIVVDNNSVDDTRAIARRYTKRVFIAGPERSSQRNFGVSKARGKFVLIIDSDMELDNDVVKDCIEKLHRNLDTKALIIPEESFGIGFWAQCKKLERSFYVGVDAVEAARFFEKWVYQKAGGYDETLISGEDWDLSWRIKQVTKIGRIENFIFHNEGKLKLSATLRKKFYYATMSDRYLQKHNVRSKLNNTVGPIQRYKLFFSRPGKLFKNPILGLGMLFMKTSEFGFGAAGLLMKNRTDLDEQVLTKRSKKGSTLKIGFFSYGILEQGGGCENYIIETASGLAEQAGHISPMVITASPRLTERLQRLLTIYFLKKHSLSNVYRESSKSIRKRLGAVQYIHFNRLSELPKLLNQNDLLYAKNEILELSILKILKNKINVPIIIGIHTPIYYPFAPSLSAKLHNLLYRGWFYKWLIQDAMVIKVNSEDDRQYIQTQFGVKNVRVIRSAFDLKISQQIQNSDQGLRILFVGRITEQKGIDKLIQVIEDLYRKPNFNLFSFKIAGSGEKSLEDKLVDLSLEHKNVQYLGHVEKNQVAKLDDWADVVIIPSYYETLNWVAAEAAVAGKIAVCSDIPGPREIIENNVTGFLVPVDASEFVAKIIELASLKANDANAFYDIGIKAQQKILRDFGTVKFYKDFREMLFRAIENA